MSEQQTCEQRIDGELEHTLKTLRLLWESYQKGEEYCEEAEGYWPDYGLCFDYVEAGTFTDQKEGYYRYQLSWGGPQDEFRFFSCECGCNLFTRVEYWFLDWWDGAHRTLIGEDCNFLLEILQHFADMDMMETHKEER